MRVGLKYYWLLTWCVILNDWLTDSNRAGLWKPSKHTVVVLETWVLVLRRLYRRPKWPRGQNFGLGIGLKDLASASASASKLWPRPRHRPQTFGLVLASISVSYYVIGHISGKNRVKFGNFVNFSGKNLKSYVVNHNHYLVLFFIIIFGLGLGLNLQKLASAS